MIISKSMNFPNFSPPPRRARLTALRERKRPQWFIRIKVHGGQTFTCGQPRRHGRAHAEIYYCFHIPQHCAGHRWADMSSCSFSASSVGLLVQQTWGLFNTCYWNVKIIRDWAEMSNMRAVEGLCYDLVCAGVVSCMVTSNWCCLSCA